jgi:RimJ/RimL family protein N-acetyltransferase
MQIVWAPSADSEINRTLSEWISVLIWGNKRQLKTPNLCFGVFKDKILQGAVAFHDWAPHYGTIEFSGASCGVNWLSRTVIREIASYAFDELGCQLLVSRNDIKDAHLIRMLTALGFDRVDIPRMHGRDKPEVLMTLTVETRNASRFIRSS